MQAATQNIAGTIKTQLVQAATQNTAGTIKTQLVQAATQNTAGTIKTALTALRYDWKKILTLPKTDYRNI